MTAINIMLQGHRGIILTDALFYSSVTGKPAFFRRKCEPVPGTKMAVAARGDYRIPEWLGVQLPRYVQTVDDIARDNGALLAELWKAVLNEHPETPIWPDVEMYVVGWSPELGMVAGLTVSLIKGQWRAARIFDQEGIIAPLPSVLEYDRLKEQGVEPGEDWLAPDFDAIRHGIPLMEAQRRDRNIMPFANLPPSHAVGGHILMTEISMFGVQQRVIHTWPDAEGEPIQPAPYRGSVQPKLTGVFAEMARAMQACR